VPVHSLVIDPNDHQILYIGTETGVYQTINGGTNWSNMTSGMPTYVPVDELVRQTGTSNLFAFTHGRSVFKTTSPLPVEVTDLSASLDRQNVVVTWRTATEVSCAGYEIQREQENKDANYQNSNWQKVGYVDGSGTTNAPHSYSFKDNNAPAGKYLYRLKQIDRDGNFKYSQTVEITVNGAPMTFELSQNYPNPFNPTTTIEFTLSHDGMTTLKIYNELGQEVATLVNEDLKAGEYHKAVFNAQNLASGIYFARLQNTPAGGQGGSQVLLKKMILLK